MSKQDGRRNQLVKAIAADRALELMGQTPETFPITVFQAPSQSCDAIGDLAHKYVNKFAKIGIIRQG